MSVVETIKSALPIGSDGRGETTSYECQSCGNTFESAKSPGDAKCMECLSREVEPV